MRVPTQTLFSVALVGLGLAGGLLLSHWRAAEAQPAKTEAPKATDDETAVHKVLEEFVNAFNAGDAKKLEATLAVTAEYIDDESNRVEGATAIRDLLATYFANNKGAKLQITPSGSRTIAAGVVIEDGESVITVPENNTQSTRRFTVVYAKVGDNWKLASIREYPEEAEVLTAEERLQELSWLIGEWIDEGGDSLVTNVVKMAADKTHLIREYSVKQEGEEVLKGMQWIGVDPLTGNIKGWSFDTAGGRSEGTWVKNGEEWLVRSSGVTSDGDESGATYIFKPLTKDRIELKVMHKVVGGVVEADSTAILVRQPALPKK